MAYTYDISKSTNDNRSTYCLTACHLLFNIINLFLSTFLVAHIYSLTTDLYQYILNVGLYQLSTYGTMFVAYFLFSFIVDKTNRIWVYRIGNIFMVALVIITIFYGEDLANVIVLAGVCYGLALSAYYASYNVLKQEMVSRKKITNYTFLLRIFTKSISVICPFLLGMLIDVSTFSTIAIVVFFIAVIQIIISFFIKAQKPENSDFKVLGFFKRLKENKPLRKKLNSIYLISVFYAFNTILSMLLNVNIMMQFGSNFTLGFITSIIALLSILILIVFNKFTKIGKRTWVFILGACLTAVSALVFAFVPNYITLIAYNLIFVVNEAIVGTIFEAIRNKNLKEAGFYQDIAEHQSVVESIFQIVRIITFVLLICISLFKNYLIFQISFGVFALLFLVMNILILLYEQKERKEIEQEETNSLNKQ